jgi:hypothetical protein
MVDQLSVERLHGKVTMNTEPLGWLSTIRTLPSCASTSRRTIDSPSPVPPYSRVELEST